MRTWWRANRALGSIEKSDSLLAGLLQLDLEQTHLQTSYWPPRPRALKFGGTNFTLPGEETEVKREKTAYPKATRWVRTRNRAQNWSQPQDCRSNKKHLRQNTDEFGGREGLKGVSG